MMGKTAVMVGVMTGKEAPVVSDFAKESNGFD